MKVNELEAANKDLKDRNNDFTKEISILNEKNQELNNQLQDHTTNFEDIVTQKDQALAENQSLSEELNVSK